MYTCCVCEEALNNAFPSIQWTKCYSWCHVRLHNYSGNWKTYENCCCYLCLSNLYFEWPNTNITKHSTSQRKNKSTPDKYFTSTLEAKKRGWRKNLLIHKLFIDPDSLEKRTLCDKSLESSIKQFLDEYSRSKLEGNDRAETENKSSAKKKRQNYIVEKENSATRQRFQNPVARLRKTTQLKERLLDPTAK